MGYYTDFQLSFETLMGSQYVFNNTNIRQALEKELAALDIFDDIDLDWSCYANAKWYDFRSDMCKLSSKYPDIVFYLHGVGESQDDLWDAYFYQGGYQYCPAEIHYESFNRHKLSYPHYH